MLKKLYMFKPDTRRGDRHSSIGANRMDRSDSTVLQQMGEDQDAATISAWLQTGAVEGNHNNVEDTGKDNNAIEKNKGFLIDEIEKIDEE